MKLVLFWSLHCLLHRLVQYLIHISIAFQVVRRRLILFDYDPTVDNSPQYESLSYEDCHSILSSLNKEEEIEMMKIKEKYYNKRLHMIRLLSLKRPGADANNSCPNISR